MTQGCLGEDVESLLLTYWPFSLRVVGERISHRSKEPRKQVREASLLPAIRIVLDIVDGEWRGTTVLG